METFVIATDGSGPASQAVDFGLALAAKQGAQAIVVHVAPRTEWAAITGPTPVRLPHKPNDADRDSLVEARARADELGVSVRTELLVGDSVDEVVAFADTVDADLIVI